MPRPPAGCYNQRSRDECSEQQPFHGADGRGLAPSGTGIRRSHLKKKVNRTEEEWRRSLTPEQYRVARQKGTERPFSGEYHASSEPGTYLCAACGAELFTSETKFDSHCGWPSFYEPKEGDNVRTEVDTSHGMIRTEVLCATCDSHLGHVFEDGPLPTGLRYCINSVVLKLKRPGEESEVSGDEA